ncbi:MAG: hypothetical protein ACYDAG_08650, partial [Chloroflexota bacterium]
MSSSTLTLLAMASGYAVALGTFMWALFGRLESRIDTLENKLTARIDGVETKLSGRIDDVETKLTARIDGMET